MLTSNFLAVFAASMVACLVTTVGIYIIRKYADWANRNVAYFICFAAGVLISVSFIHIIPKSFGMSENAPTFLLVGFLALYITNRFVSMFVCHDPDRTAVLGIIPIIGIGLHSFIDGMIYSVTFNVSIFTGILSAIGMVLHEFPEGVVTFILLERAGFSQKKSALWAFLSAALTTPLGTLVSFPFINKIGRPMLGVLLAASAGALTYVGASHLLPAVEKENKKFSLLALGAGVLVAIVIVLSKG